MPSLRGLVTLGGDQVARYVREIVIDELPLGQQPRLMPSRTEFVAFADVGEHIGAAAFQPQLPGFG